MVTSCERTNSAEMMVAWTRGGLQRVKTFNMERRQRLDPHTTMNLIAQRKTAHSKNHDKQRCPDNLLAA